ncbi:unnamed protein product [Haemonchus placei]|uniref:Uncharacterized protein n=1 Tax=Haemonchus placei TaxID=6290 RepID=A0A3P7ZD55_HAEPC|nr:unnamed protein product [Haemonchus placei]
MSARLDGNFARRVRDRQWPVADDHLQARWYRFGRHKQIEIQTRG